MKRVGRQVGQVRQVLGVPDWFVYLVHLKGRRRCARQGHDDRYTCTHCGLIREVLW